MDLLTVGWVVLALAFVGALTFVGYYVAYSKVKDRTTATEEWGWEVLGAAVGGIVGVLSVVLAYMAYRASLGSFHAESTLLNDSDSELLATLGGRPDQVQSRSRAVKASRFSSR